MTDDKFIDEIMKDIENIIDSKMPWDKCFEKAIQKSREKTIDEFEDMILSDWSKEKILKKLEELKHE